MLRRLLQSRKSCGFPGLVIESVGEGVWFGPPRSGSNWSTSTTRRPFSLGDSTKKNFKYKPERPKLKIYTPEEIFRDPKGWWNNIPPGGYFLLVIPVSTFILGIWQVYRWRWKLSVIDGMEKVVLASPVDFPVGNLESLEDMEYRKVKLMGQFDYSNEVLMGPRTLFNYAVDVKPTSPGLMGPGTSPSGYHVITPFHVEGQNISILVNRGWISDRMIKKYNSTDEVVEIVGVVRKGEKRQPFMPKESGMRDFHIFRDVQSMAEKLKTEPVFLDLVAITGMDFSSARLHNLPVPGQTRVTFRNEHVSYFCTWFSLSAITSYMWYRRFVLRKPLR